MKEQERWLPVPGWEGLYSVSDQGRVRRDRGGKGTCVGRILKPRRDSAWRLRVVLYRDGKPSQMKIHRLVMLAFVGPCSEGHEVAHADGDPTNNHLSNLRYASRSENMLDCHRYSGRMPNQKLSLEQVAEIRSRIAAGETQRSIARDYDVNRTTIRDINTGRNWAHRLDQGVANRQG